MDEERLGPCVPPAEGKRKRDKDGYDDDDDDDERGRRYSGWYFR